MKKDFMTGHRRLKAAMVFLLFVLSGVTTREAEVSAKEMQVAAYGGVSVREVREEKLIPGKRLMKTVSLNADMVTQIPRYIVEEDTPYVLDESSIVVEETGRSSSEGANVVTTSRRVEKLPDNDLERIERSITHEGLSCDLLYVVYQVTKEDEDGIPEEYSAVCEYGGLKKYSESYPSAWQATFWYDAYEITEGMEIMTELEEYEHVADGTARKTRVVKGWNRADREEETFPKPEVKKFILKKIVPGENDEETKGMLDFLLPVTAIVLGAGVIFLLPFILWFFLLTAPAYALREEDKYHYIGRVRLKKEEEIYAAVLTKHLIEKAELPVFKIKVPEKVRRETKAGILQIHCPDGRRAASICGKEVRFTLERE